MDFIEIECLCTAIFINIALMQQTIAVFREKRNKLLRKDSFGFILEGCHYGGKI
jgi:hypothetical protein